MRSLLFSVDHVYREDGTLTALELNTASGTDFPQDTITLENFVASTEGYYDHEALHAFMTSNNLTKLVTIGPVSFIKFFYVFAQYYGYEFTNHTTLPTDVTVPYVEDSPDTLIIRIAYNTYAIVDDLYARDNYEFHNLIRNESFASPVTFATSSFDTITTFELPQTSSYPNYVVKPRYPEYDPVEYPKLYSLDTESELDNIKLTLQDNEFIQKFEFNAVKSVVNERISFIRSMNLAIGDDLGQVLNLCNYVKSNALSLTNEKLVWDSYLDANKRLNPLPASQFYPTFYIRYGFTYHNDVDDYVMGHTGSLIDFEDLEVGSQLKSILFSGQLDRYMSGSLSDLSTLTLGTGSVAAITSKNEGGIFINLTGSVDGTTFNWYDGYSNPYLVYRDGSEVRGGAELGYITAGELEVGDKIYLFSSASNSLLTASVDSFNFNYKDKVAGYITIDPTSQFLMQLEPGNTDLFLVQHNFCSSNCSPFGLNPGCSGATCSDCGKNSPNCINCGGTSTLSCSGQK